MITITLTEDCGIKAGGLDIYASGIRKISCPANLGSGREAVPQLGMFLLTGVMEKLLSGNQKTLFN